MARRTDDECRQIIQRLLPIVYEDSHLVAVNKPAWIDLESTIGTGGPRIIDVAADLDAGRRADWAPAPQHRPTSLILPERLASGVALFAKGTEPSSRFAAKSAKSGLYCTHAAVVRGKPPGRVIATSQAGRKRPRTQAVGAKHGEGHGGTGRVEIVGTVGSHHIARCRTAEAGGAVLRRHFRTVGLRIAGDERRESPPSRGGRAPAARRPSLTRRGALQRSRRPMIHLEEIRFLHPLDRRPISIHAPIPGSFQQFPATPADDEERLHAALAARLECLLDEQTDCFRLFTGAAEGITGLVAEKFGAVVVVSTLKGRYQGDERRRLRAAEWYQRMLKPRAVYAKELPKRRDDAEVVRRSASSFTRLIYGQEDTETTVTENGIKYIVRTAEGLSGGLFLDQRHNRKRIQALAEGRSVLNLFAYTCGFSVAAAAGGAESTTSVDIATTNLEWGKSNFLANGLDLRGHAFIRSDAVEYCRRAHRQGRRFDVIILDPPTFARSKRPTWTFEVRTDLANLLAMAIKLLCPQGDLLLSTNNRQLTTNWLIAQVNAACGGRTFRVRARPGLPVDFAADPAHQKSVFIRFE